jgi:hypothetical protein
MKKSREIDKAERKFNKERKQGKTKKKKRQFKNFIRQGKYDELDLYDD